jgi:radical SAM-linked protein
MQMTTVRVFYAKTRRAKYVSHLDTMRTLTRALRRSGLPIWYTQGFNPHLYITFALPLSLGYEGLRESFDIRLTQELDMDSVAAAINAALPMGFEALEAAIPIMEPAAICWADYTARLIYGGLWQERLCSDFKIFCEQPLIEVVKKSKKGENIVDIKPHVRILSQEWQGDKLLLGLRAAAGIHLNINPTLFLKAFYSWSDIAPEGVRIVRTAILDGDMREFR